MSKEAIMKQELQALYMLAQSELCFTEAMPNLSPAVSAPGGITAGASMARMQAEKTRK